MNTHVFPAVAVADVETRVLPKQMLLQVRERGGGGGAYFASFIAKHITAMKPKFTLTEVDIKSFERLLAL